MEMLQSGERETEILLGNKQLLAVFFVVAALLGIAFTGGYMVGRGSAAKKPVPSASLSPETTSSNPPPQGGETHSVSPDDGASSPDLTASAAPRKGSELPLGARKKKTAQEPAPTENNAVRPAKSDGFVPEGGQEFLQVAAVPHDHALAVAAVLRKKGFHAHAVPKPGDANLYRVVVGPIRDAGDLSTTRDALRKTGFSQVIVQHYQ